jgi:uncharacterized membrane protein
MASTSDGAAAEPPSAPSEVSAFLKSAFVRGLAILLPLVVTVLILSFVLGFIAQTINPIVVALVGIPFFHSRILVTLLTIAVFAAIVVAIGIGAEYGAAGGRVESQFDAFMTAIPGVGSIYRSFDEVSDLLLDSDTDSFRDVKLVEYPGEGSYVVAFKTADTPEPIRSEVDADGMETLFMPMAPNPVMGGFVIHVESDRVIDADLTVEEGIRSIVTSGVAVSGEDAPGTLDNQQLERIESDAYAVASELRRTGSGSVVDGSQFGTDEAEPEERSDR